MNLRELNFKKTKEDLVNNFSKDIIIIQVVHTIEVIDSMITKLVANLRDRYSYYNIRDSKIQDQDEMIKKAEKFEKDELTVKFNKEDIDSIKELISEIKHLEDLKKSQEEYLRYIMKEYCPNLLKVSGEYIGAKLMDLAGSMKRLSEMAASKIQVLGAEKALFRHLVKKSKAPKFGIIFHHKSILKADNKGRAARRLAADISIAVKKDFFKNK